MGCCTKINRKKKTISATIVFFIELKALESDKTLVYHILYNVFFF